MNEQKMTDEQIKKALEIHCNDKYDNCEGCPYLKGDRCTGYLVYSEPFRDILDLLNRKDAEIERLRAEADMSEGYADALVARTKSEAIKEFAERLKEKTTSTFYEERKYVDTDDIDNLVAEMVGDSDER